MLDRYEIKGKIGRGGIGAIYRAYDTMMGREVAIKRLLPMEQTKLNESAESSLEREAAALARLNHPNVIGIYAFETDEQGPYVVMEFIKGENFAEIVQRGAVSYEDFVQIVEQTLDPMITAQENSLLHRDIKPSNIMLKWLSTGQFQVKILDFGLAKFSQQPSLQTLDQKGSFLGSIDYIAPEQIELKPLDFRTDLYSLGCVYYYILTQKAPFEGGSPALTMQNHLSGNVYPLDQVRPDVPGPVARWVMMLMSRSMDDRPGNAREALDQFLVAKDAPDTPEPAPEPVAPEPVVTAAPAPAPAAAVQAAPAAAAPHTPAPKPAVAVPEGGGRQLISAATTGPLQVGTATGQLNTGGSSTSRLKTGPAPPRKATGAAAGATTGRMVGTRTGRVATRGVAGRRATSNVQATKQRSKNAATMLWIGAILGILGAGGVVLFVILQSS